MTAKQTIKIAANDLNAGPIDEPMDPLDQLSRENTPKGILYHYTTREGLLGILSSQDIWASKIQFLNDVSEFRWSFALLNEGVTELLKERAVTKPFAEDITRFTEAVHSVNIFVVCFSERGDMLSQWRAYSQPDGGYSIGFGAERLARTAMRKGFGLLKCVYHPIRQRELILAFIRRIYHEYKRTGDLSQIGMDPLLRFAATMKHYSFSAEREWRLVSKTLSFGQDGVSFRAKKSMIVPYFPLHLAAEPKDFPVRELIIGPTPHPQLAEDSAFGLLVRYGIMPPIPSGETIQIKHSDVPFRNW